MALLFLVVCEARADFLTSSELADRLLCESIDWVEPEMLHYLRRYDGYARDEPFLTWMRVKVLAREAGIRPRGFIESEPADMDAEQARRALPSSNRNGQMWMRFCSSAMMIARWTEGVVSSKLVPRRRSAIEP